MVVVALNGSFGLLETYVVEPSKGGSTNISDTMVRNQEELLREGRGENGWISRNKWTKYVEGGELYSAHIQL